MEIPRNYDALVFEKAGDNLYMHYSGLGNPNAYKWHLTEMGHIHLLSIARRFLIENEDRAAEKLTKGID
jgi:hypothetical protein